MPAAIPCAPNGDSAWTQQTALDGTTYTLAFDWNDRAALWMLKVADTQGATIRAGMMLTTGTVLLRGCVDSRRPAGELVVVDLTGVNDTNPDLVTLGARFRLLYFTFAELEALA